MRRKKGKGKEKKRKKRFSDSYFYYYYHHRTEFLRSFFFLFRPIFMKDMMRPVDETMKIDFFFGSLSFTISLLLRNFCVYLRMVEKAPRKV